MQLLWFIFVHILVQFNYKIGCGMKTTLNIKGVETLLSNPLEFFEYCCIFWIHGRPQKIPKRFRWLKFYKAKVFCAEGAGPYSGHKSSFLYLGVDKYFFFQTVSDVFFSIITFEGENHFLFSMSKLLICTQFINYCYINSFNNSVLAAITGILVC